MTLAQYLRVLRQQWYVVVLLTGLALAGAAAVTVRETPMYSATSRLFVSVSTSESDIAQLNQGGTFTQQRVKSYADVVTSQGVLDRVIDELDLKETAAELAQAVRVDSPLDTVVLTIAVSDASPERAATIANAIAEQFPVFVTSIETPPGQSKSPVKITVTDKAILPTDPVSPRIPINLALGLVIGLALGFGAAILRDQLNTSIGSIADIEELTGGIPLGVVPYDAGTAKHPLVDGDQQGSRAEAFRTLRTNLQFADVDHPPRVIVITSALPSEGKSTSACNVALTLAYGGARVILVDGDLRKPSVGNFFGISNAAGLSTVLSGRHELRDVIVPKRDSSLFLLPSGPTPPNPSELLGSQQMVDLIATLANNWDIVVIDAPPLLPVTDAAVLAAEADGAVIVVRHGKTRRESVVRAMQTLEAVNAKLLGTVMNFAPKRMDRDAYGGYYGYGGYGRPAADTAQSPGRRQSAATPPSGFPLVEGRELKGQEPVSGSPDGPIQPNERFGRRSA